MVATSQQPRVYTFRLAIQSLLSIPLIVPNVCLLFIFQPHFSRINARTDSPLKGSVTLNIVDRSIVVAGFVNVRNSQYDTERYFWRYVSFERFDRSLRKVSRKCFTRRISCTEKLFLEFLTEQFTLDVDIGFRITYIFIWKYQSVPRLRYEIWCLVTVFVNFKFPACFHVNP